MSVDVRARRGASAARPADGSLDEVRSIPFSHRADHVGSLLRPPELLRARADYAGGRLPIEKLRDLEDAAILGALQLQHDIGLDVVTDGEFRRGAWLAGLAQAVEGFVPDHTVLEWRGGSADADEARPSVAHVVGDRLRQMRRLTSHETTFLLRYARVPAKVTLPSPQVFGQMSYKPGTTDRFYQTRADLMDHVAEIIRLEIAALLNDGVRYVQLDAPGYTYFADERLRSQTHLFGDDPDALLAASIRADNKALHGLHRLDTVLAIHLCRGNSRSQWLAEGAYDTIAERLFGSLDVDAFLLEYDSDRAGGFEPLRFVPAGKTVVLGLVSTKTPALEQVDDLRRRIDEASRYVPLDHLALSPQCGFASTADGNLLTPDDQRRKLERVVETARLVWGN